MTGPAGLYVHVPFCLTRCGYCDFNTYEGLDHLRSPYVEALATEARLAAPGWRGVAFASVFFGGGTPTTLPPADLVKLLDHLRGAFDVVDGAEVTVEANPDTVDERSLAAIRAGGVTRLSIGAQSFDPDVLRALERIHGPPSVRAAFIAARAVGFDALNVDLIYGAHGETLASWRRTLEEALALEPDHVSAYALTVEPATPLGWKVAAGLVPAPDPDLQADMYETACGAFAAAGFEHYEVSNWAVPGRRSVRGTWRRSTPAGSPQGERSGWGRRRGASNASSSACGWPTGCRPDGSMPPSPNACWPAGWRSGEPAGSPSPIVACSWRTTWSSPWPADRWLAVDGLDC